MNQAQYWGKIKISQSGGSRYEKGEREIPETVALLLRLAYGTDAQARRLLAELRSR